MVFVTLFLIWIGISVLEDLVLAKLGVAYLRWCVPVWRTTIGSPANHGARRSRLLIPLTNVRLTDSDYLLRETYKAGIWLIYPVLCFGHLALTTDAPRLQVRLRWSALIATLVLFLLVTDRGLTSGLVLILLLAVAVQCVRFRNESERLLNEPTFGEAGRPA